MAKLTIAEKIEQLQETEDQIATAYEAGNVMPFMAEKAIASIRRRIAAARRASPNPDQLAALQQYATIHGRRWKSDLGDLWQSGRANAVLQSVRNEFGPSWLESFKLPK